MINRDSAFRRVKHFARGHFHQSSDEPQSLRATRCASQIQRHAHPRDVASAIRIWPIAGWTRASRREARLASTAHGRSRSVGILRDPAAQAASIAEVSVVDGWPADPDVHLHEIVDDLDRSGSLSVFAAEFDEYGQGFASFVEVKLTRKDGSLTVPRYGGVETTGFGLLLSRFAPIAALQASAFINRSGPRSGSSSLPEPKGLTSLPVPGFPESSIVHCILQRHGYDVAAPEELRRPIAAGLEPDTNLGVAPWTVFDAWFYWYD